MFRSTQDTKPQVETNQAVFDAKTFFEAIPKDQEVAYAALREQVPPDGIATPRAQELINAGEWDAIDRFAIKCLKEGRCTGHVGTAPAGETAPIRFCGRRLADCSIQSHRSNPWSEFKPGWFVPGGAKTTSGFYKSPRLPTYADGGPVSLEVANAMAHPEQPFELTIGQWRLVIDSWWDDKIREASDLSSFGSPETAAGSKSSGSIGEEGMGRDMSMFNKPTKTTDSKPAPKEFFGATPTPVRSEITSPTEVTKLVAQVETLSQTVASLTAKLAMVQTGQVKATKEATRARTELDDLTHMYSGLVRNQTGKGVSGERLLDLETLVTGLTGVCKEVQESTSHLESLVIDPSGPVEQIKDQVIQLSKQVQMGGGVEAHGTRFSDPSGIKPWLGAVSDPLALFHDAVTLLHCIGSNSVTHKDSLSMMKAQRDVKINSDLEARVITSFRTRLPAIFYGAGSTSTLDEYVPLGNKLKSYSDWHADDNVSGVSQRIRSGIHEVHARVRQLTVNTTTHPEILRLANGLLVDSVNFINSLVSFIDMQYLDLNSGTYFTQAQVWEILVATIERIFEDMRAARAPVQDVAGDSSDRSGLIWGILKCHEVMRRYTQNDFRNDPSIHGILVQKILRCSPTSTVTSKVATLERTVGTVSSRLTSLTTKVNQIDAKVD